MQIFMSLTDCWIWHHSAWCPLVWTVQADTLILKQPKRLKPGECASQGTQFFWLLLTQFTPRCGEALVLKPQAKISNGQVFTSSSSLFMCSLHLLTDASKMSQFMWQSPGIPADRVTKTVTLHGRWNGNIIFFCPLMFVMLLVLMKHNLPVNIGSLAN